MKFRVKDLVVNVVPPVGITTTVADTCPAASCADCTRCSETRAPTRSEANCFRPDGLLDWERYAEYLRYLKEQLNIQSPEVDHHLEMTHAALEPNSLEVLDSLKIKLQEALDEVEARKKVLGKKS